MIDEITSEKLINKFRFALGTIFLLSILIISFLRRIDGFGFFPLRAYSFTSLFFLFSVFLYFYLRKKDKLHPWFKYICVIIDMLLISAAIWMGCTYLLEAPPLPFLSIQALFYIILILAGAFRYSVPCAYFSGIFASICYFLVVFINKDVLDLPYYFRYEDMEVQISFPIYNEAFRTLGMLVAGIITGMACKRNIKLTNDIIESKTIAAESSSKTVEQTRVIAETIRKSTDEIFLSSKNIFTNANNQASSVQEIESTLKENSRIASEIVDKTSSVSSIASKMENDVNHGFDILERNIIQLGNIKSKNDGVINGIISLGNKITKIRDIIKNINTITNQTKVIAFNAALEAASAGERGKRFSVVASEVNRLADDISDLTRQIRENVEEIQNSSSTLIITSEESQDQINQGNSLIKDLEEIFKEIKNGAEITANQAQTITVSTQKQQKSTEHINIAVSDIAKGLTNFIQSTRAASSSAEELNQLMQELKGILQDGD